MSSTPAFLSSDVNHDNGRVTDFETQGPWSTIRALTPAAPSAQCRLSHQDDNLTSDRTRKGHLTRREFRRLQDTSKCICYGQHQGGVECMRHAQSMAFLPNFSNTAVTDVSVPDNTTLFGPLFEATATVADNSRSSIALSTSVLLHRDAAITPSPAGSACMSDARSMARFRPASIVITPATHAATISPMLCPSTKAGVTPRARHSSDNDHSTANNAGCVCLVKSRGLLGASSPTDDG
eukprot:CAMPEP_0171792992 /NCGR_PEP_ID=MMETSP0991-20121206/67290_1 /TAXON_ID=483369 /ORGANISM="non described non described, Strain CCMP2098" /LENGTH=236 /DNA_ID=CAMNT_0012403169 /DNA_START=595 /DNA_END=1307 /DNA_ORIENTATION=+